MKMEQQSGNKSVDLTKLRHLNEQTTAILRAEMSRGDGAERKAIQLISVCGAGAAIVSAFVIAMLRGHAPSDGATVFLVTAVAICLAKSAIFALMAIRPVKKFRVDPILLVKEQITGDYAANLQANVELDLWLYKKSVPVHSTKLFYLDRAVWNIGGAVILALFSTVLQMFIAFFTNPDMPAHEFMGNVATVIGIVTIVLALSSGWLIRLIDETWTISKFIRLDLSN